MKLSLALVSLVFALAGSSVAAPAPHNLGLEVRSIRASKATGLTPLQARHSGNGNGNGNGLGRLANANRNGNGNGNGNAVGNGNGNGNADGAAATATVTVCAATVC